MADNELAVKLQKQISRNELSADNSENVQPFMKVFNPYTEFKEFTRKEIQDLEKKFKLYDVNLDKKLDIEELKVMMEKLHVPQTHLGLKEMIRSVDEDRDNKINFKEFMMIFRKARNGELKVDSGLKQLFDSVMEIDVAETGVKGAKSFFEQQAINSRFANSFEREIREEQEERRRAEELKKKQREEFKAKMSIFSQ